MQLLSNRVKFSSCTVGLTLFLFSASPLFAEDRATTGSAKSLAAAETAFAQESVEKGMRSAFLHVLSDDSIVFLPGPQNGKKAWESKPPSEAVLQWHPSSQPPQQVAISVKNRAGNWKLALELLHPR